MTAGKEVISTLKQFLELISTETSQTLVRFKSYSFANSHWTNKDELYIEASTNRIGERNMATCQFRVFKPANTLA